MADFRKRLTGFFILALVAGLGLLTRIYYLQAYESEYKEMAESQRKNVEYIDPTRGSILDKDGKALAQTLTFNSLYLNPGQVSDSARVKDFLGKTMDLDLTDLDVYLKSEESVLVKDHLTREEVDKIRAGKLSGLQIRIRTQRVYPQGELASHLIGFVGTDGHGSYGVESYFDQELFGESGLRIQSMSATGDNMPYEKPEFKDADKGDNIKLTLDSKIQAIVNQAAKESFEEFEPKKLSIIVMDPNNGKVLAMENLPNFDPNEPRAAVDEENKDKKLTDQALTELYFERWRNFAVSDIYEPGSIFKVITGASAYEEKVIDDSTIFTCEGVMEDIEGMPIYCHIYPEAHGDQDLEESMANSCNPAFAQMSLALGAEKMLAYMEAFGFTDLTGINLPAEGQGLVPESLDEFTEPRLATASYGHGIAVSPIQVATAISAVVNGGNLYKPMIVESIIDSETGEERFKKETLVRRVISEETSKRLREILVYGVDHGTADGVAIAGYEVGGKTGTSEKFIDGEYREDKTVASFVGVYPASKPEYLILAVADEAKDATSGNVVTAPLVGKIIRGIIDMRSDMVTRDIGYSEDRALDNIDLSIEENIGSEYTDQEDSDELSLMEIPDVTGYTINIGVSVLNEYGFLANIVSRDYDENSIIILQDPMGGDYASEGSIVDIVAE